MSTAPSSGATKELIIIASSDSRPGGSAASTSGRPALVEAVGVTKRFGSTTALNNVGIAIRPGEAHAVVGRNGAGKSTLVSILTGLQAPDSGQVLFDGEPAPALTDRQAWQRRVACVYQHSAIIPTLTVAENLFLNRQDQRRGVIQWNEVRRRAKDLLDNWSIDVDPNTMASDLGVEQKQMIEIARALSFGARFIILDEPTAQLDGRGIERLFERLRALTESGVSMMFISHHLEEVYEVCETVTVYRDAKRITTAPVADLPKDELIAAMTGDANLARPSAERTSTVRAEDPVLTVKDLNLPGFYDHVSLDIKPGEVVGITGSASSGRIALAESIVGLMRSESGSVSVAGNKLTPGSVPSALAAGIGCVPRDRHHQGFVPGLGVGENLTATIPHRLGRWGFVSPRKQDQFARRLMGDLSVVASGPEQPVGSLSGGNQQKIVMGRALADDPRVLVLMHPTAGVDVRSKEALMDVVDGVRSQGTGVLIVSDELDDLRPCDRLLVMLHGKVIQEFERGWTDHEVIAAVEGVGAHA